MPFWRSDADEKVDEDFPEALALSTNLDIATNSTLLEMSEFDVLVLLRGIDGERNQKIVLHRQG